MTGRTGHDISPEVAAAVAQVDRCAGEMRAAVAALNVIWRRGGHTPAEIRAMRLAGKREIRSAT